jgi:hypothetical protein
MTLGSCTQLCHDTAFSRFTESYKVIKPAVLFILRRFDIRQQIAAVRITGEESVKCSIRPQDVADSWLKIDKCRTSYPELAEVRIKNESNFSA